MLTHWALPGRLAGQEPLLVGVVGGIQLCVAAGLGSPFVP